MKKFFPFFSSLVAVLTIVLIWDKIALPYDETNLLIGDYSLKKINPFNDTLRFLIFLTTPFLVYLFLYIKDNTEIYSLNPSKKNYFLNIVKENKSDTLNIYFYLFILLIIIEFFTIDFRIFVSNVDFFHDGTFLVPAINFLEKRNIFSSTLYDYGYVANNLATISNYILGSLTLGGFIFIELILIFFVKFSLILISKNIVSFINIEDFQKKLFFIIFTFIIISLPDYYDHYRNFSPRSVIYLIFILLLATSLFSIEKRKQLFIIGAFSIGSILWWFDIGAYVNTLIILTLIYFLIHKDFRSFIILSLSILTFWGFFLILLSPDSLVNFFHQLKFIFSVSDYILGIEFRAPFSLDSGRWTKILVMFYLVSIMLIHFNLDRKYAINFNLKIFLNILFLASIIGFKSALMRSDSYHVKYASGIVIMVFLFLLLLFIFQKLKLQNRTKKVFKKFKINQLVFISILLYFFSSISDSNHSLSLKNKIINIFNSKDNLSYLINSKDKDFLSEGKKLVIERYKDLSKEDNCIQILTDDISFPYFLKKPTCTQYFIPAVQVLNGISEKRFLDQLKISSPNVILYKSNNNILMNYQNMPNTLQFIEERYSFYENYEGYIFFKKK